MNRIQTYIKKMSFSFWLIVMIPTSLAVLYFGLIASDVFVSEASFVVKSPQRQGATSLLGGFLQNAGFTRSQDDTYTVHEYVLSRDAMTDVNKVVPLRDIFSGSNIDFFSRFNAFRLNDSDENLFKYYQNHVLLSVDTATAITRIQIKAFTSEDAHKLNTTLLDLSEKLVNKLNERARLDLINSATEELTASENKLRDAGVSLSEFRNANRLFDPERQSAIEIQMISKLQDQLVATQIQIAQVKAVTPDNPQISALIQRQASIKQEIDNVSRRVTGGGSNLTSKIEEYERLSLNKAVAEKQLASSISSLEQAKNDAARKQFYLETVVQPSKPDVAMEPERIKGILSVFVFGLIIWGIVELLLAGVKEHQS